MTRFHESFSLHLWWGASPRAEHDTAVPIYLNLVTAVLALGTVLGLREPSVRETRVAPQEQQAGAEVTAWHLLHRAGSWILKTPSRALRNLGRRADG